jgi:hypothetical protein
MSADATAITVAGLLEHLCPGLVGRQAPPAWPPDAFALAASLLQDSGVYLDVVAQWPPIGRATEGGLPVSPSAWAATVRRIGQRWRRGVRKDQVPDELRRWWRIVFAAGPCPLPELAGERGVCRALLQICAAADEACAGVGFPFAGPNDLLNEESKERLVPDPVLGSSLCRDVHPSRARVLPKSHTPQSGLTLASLTHNLALWRSGDVLPKWYMVPPSDRRYLLEAFSLNLLLVPWPQAITPTQFRPCTPPSGRLHLANSFGFFRFDKKPEPDRLIRRLALLFEEATRVVGRIEVVIFPELALARADYDAVSAWARGQNVVLICGVGESPRGGLPGVNYVALEIPVSSTRHAVIHQSKHHRWRLDRSQIVQYGLGGQLDPERQWWEHTRVEARSLAIVALLPWLSLAVLVCEDLARQEPVAQLVRSLGPNLVIALLMDGPQLASRWPARYATVLADDPGSSVLTLTSIGMAELSRPPGRAVCRSVALWKDAKTGGAREIELPPGNDGLVLSLTRQIDEEWTADGRSHGRSSSYPILGGVHPLRIPDRRHSRSTSRRG